MCFDAVLPDGTETKVRILSTVDRILIGECFFEKLPDDAGVLPQKGVFVPPIALFQGLPRGNKLDLIVRQAAEGGVSLVQPFESEYSTARLKSSAEKQKRLERIITEARQQSGSVTATEVNPACDFNGLLEYWELLKKKYKNPLGIVLHQEPLEKGAFHEYLGSCPDFVALAVGPEGGFSPGETARFLAGGFKPLVIGNTVLRTETAALYGTAVIRILLLERETWTPSLKG